MINGATSVCNREGAMEIVMEKEREIEGGREGGRERSRWRSSSRTETPKDRCQMIVREEFWGNCSAVVLCLLCIGVAVSH